MKRPTSLPATFLFAWLCVCSTAETGATATSEQPSGLEAKPSQRESAKAGDVGGGSDIGLVSYDQLSAFLAGLADSMEKAAENLGPNGQRLHATKALDDARRIARVLNDAAPESMRQSVQGGLEAVRKARHSLQNGDSRRAAEILKKGSQATRNAEIPDDAIIKAVEATGKMAINAKGAELGRVDRFITGENGRQYAVLKEKGVTNLFGFLDLGNTLVIVPRNKVVGTKRKAAIASDLDADQLISARPYRPD